MAPGGPNGGRTSSKLAAAVLMGTTPAHKPTDVAILSQDRSFQSREPFKAVSAQKSHKICYNCLLLSLHYAQGRKLLSLHRCAAFHVWLFLSSMPQGSLANSATTASGIAVTWRKSTQRPDDSRSPANAQDDVSDLGLAALCGRPVHPETAPLPRLHHRHVPI